MDLGRISVRGQSINVLHQALHPKHGLVWTDGKSINLAPVHIQQGQVDNQKSIKLGEFEHSVKSVHWSSNIGPQTCYMCVVHPQHVSIWKVDGTVPKLSFKQVRKLNVQPIQQGCLWNPGRDILCVLSKQQCSFFFRHTQNRGSYAFPQLESGKISCGTWSEDGSRLVLCVGAVLLIYTWSEIDMSISDFTPAAWRIPDLDGSVTSVTHLSNDMVICAAELPLESLCKSSDTFIIPDMENHTNGISDQNGFPVIVPRKSKPSIKDTLLNLPRNPEGIINDTSQIITIQLLENQDPRKRCCVRVKGILTPEILVFEPSLSSIVIGSNTQNYLQVFTFEDGVLSKNLIKTMEIHLDKLERPKGICCLPSFLSRSNKGVLMCVGVKIPSDPAFLPSSTGTASDVKLKFYPIQIDFSALQAKSRLNGSSESLDSAISSLSSLGSPRQRIKIQNQSDMESAQSSPRDLNTSTETDQSEVVSRDISETDKCNTSEAKEQDHLPCVDIYLPKQNTVSELREASGVDSDVSLKDSVSDNDSPREITLQTQQEQKSKVEIIDLNKSEDNESDLETETVKFSEQKANFKVQNSSECFQDVLGNDSVDNVSDNGSCNKENRHKSLSDSPIEDQVKHENIELDSTAEQVKHDDTAVESTSENVSAAVCSTEKLVMHEVKTRNLNQEEMKYDSIPIPSTEEQNKHVGLTSDSTLKQDSCNGLSLEEEDSQENDDDLVTLMEKHIVEQQKQIELLKKKLDKMSRQVEETSVVFPTRYQSASDPETVLVVCRYPNNKTSRKTFLLDDGRLHLETMKRTFNLATVELFIDGEPCVLGSNIDGYIPMRFKPSTTLIVTGQPARVTADKHSTDLNKHHSDIDSEEEGIEAYETNNANGTVC